MRGSRICRFFDLVAIRRGRELSFDDILHYQKIVVALCETDRIMKAIDRIDFLE
jgi:hypothetical protein